MKLWIDEHFPDLESDPEAVKHVERFISEVIAKDMPGPAAQLQKQLKDRVRAIYTLPLVIYRFYLNGVRAAGRKVW